MKRPLRFVTRATKPVEIVQRMVNGTSVSLLRMPSLNDIDPHGTWGCPAAVEGGRSVTAEICGDPAPGRSALAQRLGGLP